MQQAQVPSHQGPQIRPMKPLSPSARPRPNVDVKDGTPNKQKQCNCKHSRCLKLYCECFESGIYCEEGCSCVNCQNNVENDDVWREAVEATLERNPNAFRQKIASSQHGTRDSKNNVENNDVWPEAVEATLERNPNAFRQKIASSQHGTHDSKMTLIMKEKYVHWPTKVEFYFIQLLYEEAKKGLQIDKEAWEAMDDLIWSTYGKRYTVPKLKSKYNNLRKKYREFGKLLEFYGMGWDPVKNKVQAPEDVWVNYLKKNPIGRCFRNKGCEHYSILGSIFNGTTKARGQMAFAWTQSPDSSPHSLEEREVESEFLKCGAHIDVDKQFVYEALDDGDMVLESSKEGNASKRLAVDPLLDRRVKKASKNDFALEAWDKSPSVKTVTSLAGPENITNPEGVSSKNLDPYSIDECMRLLESLEDVNDDAYGKACERFTLPDWRRIFMHMSDGRREAWVRNLK